MSAGGAAGGRGGAPPPGPDPAPRCLRSLYDIYWSQDIEDSLRALEERKPSLKIIS